MTSPNRSQSSSSSEPSSPFKRSLSLAKKRGIDLFAGSSYVTDLKGDCVSPFKNLGGEKRNTVASIQLDNYDDDVYKWAHEQLDKCKGQSVKKDNNKEIDIINKELWKTVEAKNSDSDNVLDSKHKDLRLAMNRISANIGVNKYFLFNISIPLVEIVNISKEIRNMKANVDIVKRKYLEDYAKGEINEYLEDKRSKFIKSVELSDSIGNVQLESVEEAFHTCADHIISGTWRTEDAYKDGVLIFDVERRNFMQNQELPMLAETVGTVTLYLWVEGSKLLEYSGTKGFSSASNCDRASSMPTAQLIPYVRLKHVPYILILPQLVQSDLLETHHGYTASVSQIETHNNDSIPKKVFNRFRTTHKSWSKFQQARIINGIERTLDPRITHNKSWLREIGISTCEIIGKDEAARQYKVITGNTTRNYLVSTVPQVILTSCLLKTNTNYVRTSTVRQAFGAKSKMLLNSMVKEGSHFEIEGIGKLCIRPGSKERKGLNLVIGIWDEGHLLKLTREECGYHAWVYDRGYRGRFDNDNSVEVCANGDPFIFY